MKYSIHDFDTQGACHNLSLARDGNPWYPFYGPDGEKSVDALKREDEARLVCGLCTVQEACLEYSLEREKPSLVSGFFGGKSEEERKEILRTRRRAE